MKQFLASNNATAIQIRKNIAYSLNKSSKLKGAKTGTEQFVKTNKTTTTPKKRKRTKHYR